MKRAGVGNLAHAIAPYALHPTPYTRWCPSKSAWSACRERTVSGGGLQVSPPSLSIYTYPSLSLSLSPPSPPLSLSLLHSIYLSLSPPSPPLSLSLLHSASQNPASTTLNRKWGRTVSGGALQVSPQTLTPYTLHLTPYTLNHKPYTLHPTP